MPRTEKLTGAQDTFGCTRERVKQNPPFLRKKVERNPFCRLKKLKEGEGDEECQFSHKEKLTGSQVD